MPLAMQLVSFDVVVDIGWIAQSTLPVHYNCIYPNNADQHAANLVEKLLCVPASSAPAERAFSSAGKTVTKDRNRLSGDHVEAINFLHLNQEVL